MKLLEMSEIYYTEYKLGRDFTKEEFYSKFGTGSTFPRVMVGDQLIGGCSGSEAVKYLKENNLV
jgi:glutaredoxin